LALYLLWSRLSKAVALRYQHRGLRLAQAGLFEQAADAFATSFERLSRHAWVDRYRFVVLLDASAVAYRELALVNIAYCQLRRGATRDALAAYRAALRTFPHSTMARDGELECERLLATDDAP
jgi:tetratricopeptide (TPR) repeat protein